jgi:hypothetical protein
VIDPEDALAPSPYEDEQPEPQDDTEPDPFYPTNEIEMDVQITRAKAWREIKRKNAPRSPRRF